MEEARWTPRRWLAVSTVFFVAQVLGVFVLSERMSAPAPRPPAEPQMVLVPAPASLGLLDNRAVNDPTMLALANPRGFSGSPWLNSPPPMHRPLDWSEPETWISQSTSSLAATFRQFVKTNTAGRPLKTEKPLPRPASIEVAPQVLIARSSLRAEGAVAARITPGSVTLPDWRHTNVLTDTAIQVTVDGRGYTHSAVLLTSGPRDAVQVMADQYALGWVRTNRFAPSSSQVSGGVLYFQWHTLPPNGVEKSNGAN